MPAVAISLLRYIEITVICQAASKKSEEVLEEMILQMETRFVVGTLVGMSTAWTITTFLLGMNAAMWDHLIVLLACPVYLRLRLNCFAKARRESSRRLCW